MKNSLQQLFVCSLFCLWISPRLFAYDNRDASADAVASLKEYLALAVHQRGPWQDQAFLTVPLNKEDAQAAKDLLAAEQNQRLRQEQKPGANGRGAVSLNGASMSYLYREFGSISPGGRSLFISMHGGGGAPPAVNDQQWHNQINLYQPSEGIYLAPRAPGNTWDLWHRPEVDAFFERLIATMVAHHQVNPNRVYLMGYSAGGDGAYQLAPRFADRLAAATAAAGHPNDASPLGLRNIGFSIHVGGRDQAYNRNQVAAEWRDKLQALHQADPEGYQHSVTIHEGLGHWMNLRDAVAVPWMAGFTRQPWPNKVVWQQDDVVHPAFYWLAVDNADARPGTVIRAHYDKQEVEVEGPAGLQVHVRLHDTMLDLDRDITVRAHGNVLFQGTVQRTIATLQKTLAERSDAELMASAELSVTL